MSTILDEIIEAYGGLERWRDATTIEADAEYGGLTWELKGVTELVGTEHIVADVHRQRITFADASGRVIEFDKAADVVTVTAPDGTAERLEHPRASFEGLTFESPWTVPQAAYFRAYATWLHVVGAYVLTYPGVEVVESEGRIEDGESWRGLRVTIPETLDAHNTTLLYYVGAKGLFARVDYDAQINGGAQVTHYLPEHVSTGGLVVDSSHEVFVRNADGTPDRSLMPVKVELSGITVH